MRTSPTVPSDFTTHSSITTPCTFARIASEVYCGFTSRTTFGSDTPLPGWYAPPPVPPPNPDPDPSRFPVRYRCPCPCPRRHRPLPCDVVAPAPLRSRQAASRRVGERQGGNVQLLDRIGILFRPPARAWAFSRLAPSAFPCQAAPPYAAAPSSCCRHRRLRRRAPVGSARRCLWLGLSGSSADVVTAGSIPIARTRKTPRDVIGQRDTNATQPLGSGRTKTGRRQDARPPRGQIHVPGRELGRSAPLRWSLTLGAEY